MVEHFFSHPFLFWFADPLQYLLCIACFLQVSCGLKRVDVLVGLICKVYSSWCYFDASVYLGALTPPCIFFSPPSLQHSHLLYPRAVPSFVVQPTFFPALSVELFTLSNTKHIILLLSVNITWNRFFST